MTVQDIAVRMQHAEKYEKNDPINNPHASDKEENSELSVHDIMMDQDVDSTSSEVKLVIE